MATIAIINPKFEVSYWGLEYSQSMMGKRANMPVASLPLLAALTPPEHEVLLVDENVEPIDFARLAECDIVGITGMIVQRYRMLDILKELRKLPCYVVVGGPWVTVEEGYFGDLVDTIFVGEAELTWPQFLEEWGKGKARYRYEQAEKTDMATVPPPRHDLLKNSHYMFSSIQFSRGCPFQCEFCDIIVTFGRRPRIKHIEQIRLELDGLHALKIPIAFIVDDNLIGNKKGIKPILEAVAQWQEERGYPIAFTTEASLDLCEDEELMELMARCNILSVFIGIETPNEKALQETKKFQNIRQGGGTLIQKVRKIQDFGIEVWCGLIVGFDNDSADIFEIQQRFLKDSRIAMAMIGLLHAIPKTPLFDRLESEGRLDRSDSNDFGTNVIPLNMSREQLRDGYIETMRVAYQPENYFGRLDQLYIHDQFRLRAFDTPYFKNHLLVRLRHAAFYLIGFLVISWRLMRGVPERHLRKEYAKRLWGICRSRILTPSIPFYYATKCAAHYHYYKMTSNMASHPGEFISSFSGTNRQQLHQNQAANSHVPQPMGLPILNNSTVPISD
jgi:radical SAM superfamily enzyme YgiQ (UPF0313 family)